MLLLLLNLWLLDPKPIRAHVRFLADDLMEGREATTRGQEIAARYIASHFEAYGLEPLLSEGERPYDQPFHMYRSGVNTEKTVLKMGDVQIGMEDFAFSGTYPKTGVVKGPVVFLGYGFRSSKHNFNDYDGIDLTGKVVVVLDGYPDHISAEFNDSDRRRQHNREKKVGWIQKAGALGAVFIPGPSFGKPDLRPTATDALDLNGRVTSKPSPTGGTDFPIIELSEAGFAKLFAKQRSKIEQNLADRASQKVALPLELAEPFELTSLVENLELLTQNVGAIIRGSDPVLKNEYLVLSAHYDHLGLRHGEIYRGADDNASGTALLLELARELSTRPLKRSVLFLAMSAEEKGLVGSGAFLGNCPIPLASIVGDINVDMVGRNDPFEIGIIPALNDDVSSLNDTVKALNLKQPHPLTLLENLDQYHARSDHYSFVKRDIPALFFTSGDHSDYHKPSDTWDKLDYEKIARVGVLVEDLIEAVANAPERPHFSKPDRKSLKKENEEVPKP